MYIQLINWAKEKRANSLWLLAELPTAVHVSETPFRQQTNVQSPLADFIHLVNIYVSDYTFLDTHKDVTQTNLIFFFNLILKFFAFMRSVGEFIAIVFN